MKRTSIQWAVFSEKMIKAYANWQKFTKMPYSYNSASCFLDFLGCKQGETTLSEETRKKIEWLTGPHAETMYKAWKARHQP